MKDTVKTTEDLLELKYISRNEYFCCKPWCNDLPKVRYSNLGASDTSRQDSPSILIENPEPIVAVHRIRKIVIRKIVPSFVKHLGSSHTHGKAW